MNINMLSDADNDAGFYAAANGGNTSWRGASLLRSTDGGSSYAVVGAFDTPAAMGVTTTALGQFYGGNTPDEINTLNVTLSYGELSSVSYASFVNGTQAALVGDEIICFRDATLNVDGSYTLQGLLRGRRGSGYAMTAGHAIGDRFVLLAGSAIKRIADVTASIGLVRLYKAVNGGYVAGLANDLTAEITAAADTWQEVTLTFSPTEAGVIEVLGYGYGGTTHVGYFDDLTITQL